MRLLEDQGLVEGAGEGGDLGYYYFGEGTFGGWNILPLRLTASGHNFAASLREQTVVAKLKDKLADAGLGVWINVALPLAVEVAKQRIGLPG